MVHLPNGSPIIRHIASVASVEFSALPSNRKLQLTGKSVTCVFR